MMNTVNLLYSVKAVATSDGILHIFKFEEIGSKEGNKDRDINPFRSYLLKDCEITPRAAVGVLANSLEIQVVPTTSSVLSKR